VSNILEQLVSLSRALGHPDRDCTILGEGNTSALEDDGTFWIKASGRGLADATPADFVRVDFVRALSLLDAGPLDDDALARRLAETKADRSGDARPSVETMMHAACLALPGVSFIGHTHPTAINAMTCSRGFAAAAQGRLFPDEVVVCGPESVLVPYVDPGPPLARAVREAIERATRRGGETPKMILLQNHGLVALGASAREVEGITAMAVKAARIRLGTFALGGPNALDPHAVERIHTRPDEHHRQRELGVSPPRDTEADS
jgi:rhamnose utilization protein RhaD (predicted bifunctional aldolase and dehydrogenase)